MLGWHQHELHKKCTEICYTELVFSHLVECTSHVVHSGASGAQNMNALFFMLGWEQYGFHKKRSGTHYVERVFSHSMGSVGHIVHSLRPGCKTSMYYFLCSGGTNTNCTKSAPGHVW
jgi:hypothetical protein